MKNQIKKQNAVLRRTITAIPGYSAGKWNSYFRGILIILFSTIVCGYLYSDPAMGGEVEILVVTGGHEFDSSFFQIFDSFADISYDRRSQPAFNKFLSATNPDDYDAIVFYDTWQKINDTEKNAYSKLLDGGKGMLFLHHALVSYQHWDEFQQIIGGKYIEAEYYNNPDLKVSGYKQNIELDLKILDSSHPVTSGIPDFNIHDEGYQNIEVNPGINPLISTSHPDCTPVVAWEHRYKKSKIVYILLGHGPQAFQNDNYRKLIRNAIFWISGKELRNER